MPRQYQRYSDVPWYRKNWFAILLFLLFFPPLLPILLTGNIYFEKDGELKQYASSIRIALIVLSTLLLGVSVYGVMAGKAGRLFDIRSSEDEFLSNLEGVWQSTDAAYTCAMEEQAHRLVCFTNEEGVLPLFEITANGKFDSDNKSLPIKIVAEVSREKGGKSLLDLFASAIESGQLPNALNLDTPVASNGSNERYALSEIGANKVYQRLANEQKLIEENRWGDLLSESDAPTLYASSDMREKSFDAVAQCLIEEEAKGTPKDVNGLPHLAAATSASGAVTKITQDSGCPDFYANLMSEPVDALTKVLAPNIGERALTLRDMSEKDTEFHPVLIPDSGNVISLSFVRRLNDTEAVQLPNLYQTELNRRAKFETATKNLPAAWQAAVITELKTRVAQRRSMQAASNRVAESQAPGATISNEDVKAAEEESKADGEAEAKRNEN